MNKWVPKPRKEGIFDLRLKNEWEFVRPQIWKERGLRVQGIT